MTTTRPHTKLRREDYNLTPRQWDWCLAYMTTRSGTQAAKLAGYADKGRALTVAGSQNLAKPNIQRALQALRASESKTRVIDQDWATDKLLEIHSAAMVAGTTPDLAVARGVVVDIARLHGLIQDHRQVTHSGSVSISHERISASREELIAMLAQVREQQALPAPQIERADADI